MALEYITKDYKTTQLMLNKELLNFTMKEHLMWSMPSAEKTPQ
jgi:hypothetical protein